ncbi:hypothetical protein LWC33_11125 [Pseudonocardia sp. RS11V-5]|uniref:hypothetical protein n=1 Tax=Pseudonocardia terrae TaxID=2905831 RepID=UPI001E519FA1|nr:hypothetical protein [Pseudonocardia terrae]MCE3552010.1 hypothetical protein [Pseudonocardia terrae]
MDSRDLRSRWTIRGDPALLSDAAAALRAARAEQIFGSRFPGEYVMAGIARLLESLAYEMRTDDSALTRDVVLAATDMSRHVLRYLPELDDATSDRPHDAESDTAPADLRDDVDAAREDGPGS